MTYNLIPDLARAYHCPHHMAALIANSNDLAYRVIESLGPVRAWWSKSRTTWIVDNMPMSHKEILRYRFTMKEWT